MEEKVLDYKLTIKHSRLLEILMTETCRITSPSYLAIPRMEFWEPRLSNKPPTGAALLITDVGVHLIAERVADKGTEDWIKWWERLCKDYGVEIRRI